jgi:hypothetical protein
MVSSNGFINSTVVTVFTTAWCSAARLGTARPPAARKGTQETPLPLLLRRVFYAPTIAAWSINVTIL